MKKIINSKKIALVAFVIVATMGLAWLTSCSTTTAVTNQAEAKTRDVHGLGVVHVPVIADLEVSPQRQRHEYPITLERPAHVPVSQTEINAAKSMAVAQLLMRNNADVLIEPIFEVQVNERNLSRNMRSVTIRVTVSGFLGSYKNFRQMRPTDTTLMQAGFNYTLPRTISATVTTR